ncbi:hypothetical protein ACJRO7_024925 [Eucalyptus globulus]|uniref:Thioesterase domain-containing protein n=1 Tax=Eucalyptus globulus TaxID=34317 RepID=A0ABD3KB35_EUCGL
MELSIAIVCTFVVPDRLSGRELARGSATLVDDIGAATAYCATGNVKATLDFCVSYLSTVKIQEEVEIESKVVGAGSKGKLAMVVAEVKEEGQWQVDCLG